MNLAIFRTIMVSLSVAGLLLGLGSSVSLAAKVEKREYILGVFPYLPPRELEKIYVPMAEDLSHVVGHEIRLRSKSTFKKFMSSLDDQTFDIVFVQPFDYIRIADVYGYEPLATWTDKLASILIVNEKSPIKSIDDIKGKKIAFPPKVAAVTRLMKGKLTENGFDLKNDVNISYYRSHMSCMQHVLSGVTDLCGTVLPLKELFERKMKVKMRIVVKSREIPHVLFAIHPRVPKKQRELLRQRILSWSKTEAGKKILSFGRLKSFRAIEDRDYDIVRKLAR